MEIGNEQEEILKDIDRLKICYQIKLYSPEKKDWQPYFQELSLDSHQNNQLCLDYHQLFFNHKPSIVLSGLALGKENHVKEIYLVGDNCCILGEIGCASPALKARLPNIKHSSNSRWRCALNFSSQEKQSFELIVWLSNNQKFIYKKIELCIIKLSYSYQEINHQRNSVLGNKIKSIYHSRKLMANRILQQKNYLFAIGNARSGTTALGQVLNSSPEICLGIERYSTEDNILASSFEQEAFFDSESENYLVRPHFYEEIKDKFAKARYIGDKRPRFIQSWKNTWLNLPQAKIVYIFRNIYDIACSYNTRANNASLGKDTSWSKNRDFSKAVEDWNEGLQEIKQLRHFYEVYLVKYEDFFSRQTKMIHLFNYLKIDSENQNIKRGINEINQAALKLKKKERTLSDLEKKYIDSYADFESYNILLTLYEQQFSKEVISNN